MISAIKYWKYIVVVAAIIQAGIIGYNWGYDRRDAIATKQEQAYQEALQESLRKKYVIEKAIVTKYLERKQAHEDKVDAIIDRIDKGVPTVECDFPDAVIGLFNESLFGDAVPARSFDASPEILSSH